MTRTKRRQRAPAPGLNPPGIGTVQLPVTPVFWLSAALLTVAFVFGGQSRDNPLSTMAVEFFGVLLLAAVALSGSMVRTWRAGWQETALLGAMFAIPILQLIPLPPEIWMTLPGRGEAVETLRLSGVEPGWAPLSLDPEATFRCLLWLVPPAALFLAVADMSTGARIQLVGAILALCIASLVLGGLQITDSDGGLFASPAGGHASYPIGFFANRNHQGVAMVAALPFAAAFAAIWGSAAPTRTRMASAILGALAALLIVGVLVTRSRAAVTLAGPALVAGIGIFLVATGTTRLRRGPVLVVAAVAVVLVIAAQFAISAALVRFQTLAEGDARFDFWATTLRASAGVAPFGSGLGTFVPIYRSWEPLNLMGPNFVNNAHNEYIQLWLEAGWLAPLIFVPFFLWLVRAMIRVWRGPATQSILLARAGSIAILVLLAHSVVDYPLRTQALACVFAFAMAYLARGGRPSGRA